MVQAFDLSLIKRAEDTALAFEVQEGIVNALKGVFEQHDGAQLAVPVLCVKMHMANGEVRKQFNVPLPMVMPLMHALLTFAMGHSNATVAEVMSDDNGH